MTDSVTITGTDFTIVADGVQVFPVVAPGSNTATLPSGEVIALPATSVLTPGTIRTSDLDLTGTAAGWMVKGVTFNGCGIIANSPGFIVGCTINSTPTKYPNGSAFAWQGAHDMVFINTEFNGVQGVTLGTDGWNNVRVLCCGFTGCTQSWSMDTSADYSQGNNIEFGWCHVSAEQRGGFETGGDASSGVGQAFTNLVVHDSSFVDWGPQETDAFGAISFVARGQRGTKFLHNFFRLGSNYGSGFAQAIELSVRAGQGNAPLVDNCTFVDIANGDCVTDNGVASVRTNNKAYNCAQAIGTVLASKPADPARQFAVIA